MAMRLLVAVVLAWLALPAVAQADPRSRNLPTNTQGDIAFAANTVLSCVADETGCPAASDASPGRRSSITTIA